MKLYSIDRRYAGGIAIVAQSREEATALAREQLGEGGIGGYSLRVPEPDEWRESPIGKAIFFWGDV